MGLLRRLLKPRKSRRYYTDKGAFVVVSPYAAEGKKGKRVQILDISEGGCAFIYKGTKEELVESGLLTLMDDDTPCLESVDFVTVSDHPLPQYLDNSGLLRRRGVKFKWLGVFDRDRLNKFIEQNALGHTS